MANLLADRLIEGRRMGLGNDPSMFELPRDLRSI
jgi:hypothetical protein